MPENFNDAQRIKKKRAGSFMGAAREIKEIPQVKPPVKVAQPKTVSQKPQGETMTVTQPPVIEPKKPTVESQEDKLTVQKGFIVGRTEDGKILFKPFGSPDKVELIGFVEYAKAVSTDLLNELANTSTYETRSIKNGMTAALQGIKALLDRQSDQSVKAAS